MTEEKTPTARNPFQEVCIFLSKPGNDLAIADLIKRSGFTVYAFVSLARMGQHLAANPLTAAAFVQGNLDQLEPQVREHYHGPVFALADDRESLLATLEEQLAEIHRNQLRVADPKVIRVLKTIDAFCQGTQKTLLLLGPDEALDRAAEFLRLFYPLPLQEVTETLPTASPTSGAFLTRDLFSRDLAWQQLWNLRFGQSDCPHVVLEAKTTDELDGLYIRSKLDEMLFERLSFRQMNVDPLAGFSVEELAVQPLQKNDPRFIFDGEMDTTAHASTGPSQSGRSKGATRRADGAPAAPGAAASDGSTTPAKGGLFGKLFGKR